MERRAAAPLLAQHSVCCAAKRQREGYSLPLPPKANPQLRDWQAQDSLLLVRSGSLELTKQDNRSACLSSADGCLSGRKLCLSQGGKIEELLVAYRSFWDTDLLSCLCLLLKRATKTITL